MKPDETGVDIGDWVYSDSPGIWRVIRVVQDVQKLRFTLEERKRMDRKRLIFCKRIVDQSWKPAFTTELASDSFVHPLSNDDQRRLDEFITANPQTLEEFEAFQPKGIDRAMDLPLNVPITVGRQDVQRLIQDVFAGIGDQGFTNDEILQRLTMSELAHYAPRTIRNATLRFLCKNHELRNNEYVFKEVQLIMM